MFSGATRTIVFFFQLKAEGVVNELVIHLDLGPGAPEQAGLRGGEISALGLQLGDAFVEDELGQIGKDLDEQPNGSLWHLRSVIVVHGVGRSHGFPPVLVRENRFHHVSEEKKTHFCLFED